MFQFQTDEHTKCLLHEVSQICAASMEPQQLLGICRTEEDTQGIYTADFKGWVE